MMEIPILQSEAWKKLQDDLKEKSFLVKEKGFQYLAILKNTPVGNYLYCPYGPVAAEKSDFKHALASLENLGKENNCIFVRIEPVNEEYAKFLPKNAKKSQDLNPKETWLLDLAGSEEDLKAKIPSRLFRYYKNLEKSNLKIEVSHTADDIKHLINLQNALAIKKGINTFSETYLKTEAKQPFSTIYLLKSLTNNEVIAAGLVFDDDHTRYNLQGAQSEEGRKLHATGILTVQLILDAHKKGLKHFDFWGIAPENAPKNHPWAGFTNFKKTFAGYEVKHAGDYDIILSKKYTLYQIFRKINRLIRK